MQYKYCYNNIILPYITGTRTNVGHNGGKPIPDEMSTVCNIKQVEAIVSDVKILVGAKISANKQSPDCPGREQLADRIETFKLVANLQGKYSCTSILAETNPTKNVISRNFDILKGEEKLDMKTIQRNSLVDFLSILSVTLT